MAKKIPLRRCIATQEMLPKQQLLRIVKTKDNQLIIDPSGKQNGRGAYIQMSLEALAKAKKHNALAKSFQMKVDDTIYEQLADYINQSKIVK